MMIYECYCKPFQAWWILQLSSPSKPRLGQMGWHTSNANQSVGSDGGLWILEMSTWANTAGQDQERTTWATGIGDANCYHTTILANWAFLSKCVFSCRHPERYSKQPNAIRLRVKHGKHQALSVLHHFDEKLQHSVLNNLWLQARNKKDHGPETKQLQSKEKFHFLQNSMHIWSETLWGQNFTVAWRLANNGA